MLKYDTVITQAFKDHKLHDPLIDPGSADLTADVDFRYLKSLARDKGCKNKIIISKLH